MKPDLSVEIAGIRLQSLVINAAGTFELEDYHDLIDLSKLIFPKASLGMVAKAIPNQESTK